MPQVTLETQDAIAAANESLSAALARGDAAGMAALYTKDGQLLPPNSETVSGADGLAGFWQAVMDMGIAGAELRCVELEDFGDTAIEVGAYSLLGGDGQTLDSGKYIVIWKREGGEWRLHRDIFNTSLPAPE